MPEALRFQTSSSLSCLKMRMRTAPDVDIVFFDISCLTFAGIGWLALLSTSSTLDTHPASSAANVATTAILARVPFKSRFLRLNLEPPEQTSVVMLCGNRSK